jgi:hypothetical protein
VLTKTIKTIMSKMIEMSKLLVDMVDLVYLVCKIIIFFNQTINGPKFPSPKLVVAMPKKWNLFFFKVSKCKNL